MYQNMDCVILGYQLLNFAASYTVYNSAGEQVINPKLLNSGMINIGVCVPYGGSIEIEMDSTHSLAIKHNTGYTNLLTIQPTLKYRIPVVRDYIGTVNTVTNTNGRIVETPITE